MASQPDRADEGPGVRARAGRVDRHRWSGALGSAGCTPDDADCLAWTVAVVVIRIGGLDHQPGTSE